MVSDSKKFIFIHINKTAGGSIEQALKEYWNEGKWGHETTDLAKNRVGEEKFHSYFKFTFVRNPWDRMVSLYHFHKQIRQILRDEDTKTFEEWIKSTKTWKEYEGESFWKNWWVSSQLWWITNAQTGSVEVDFIGRFENLHKDWKAVTNKIGVSADLPWTNKTEHKHYSEYYDDESRRIIADKFRDDIDYFGYTFETN